jgi:hypothetical protein
MCALYRPSQFNLAVHSLALSDDGSGSAPNRAVLDENLGAHPGEDNRAGAANHLRATSASRVSALMVRSERAWIDVRVRVVEHKRRATWQKRFVRGSPNHAAQCRKDNFADRHRIVANRQFAPKCRLEVAASEV